MADQHKRTPLPKLQLFVAYYTQFAEPLIGTVIYPFVNQFVRDTGVTNGDPRKTGYYSGIIESAFYLGETLTVFQWGYLSDYHGRRPILLLGPFGLTFAILGFGFSKTFWPLVVLRFIQGVFNGNIGVSKTVVGEITDSTNIADAVSFFPLAWGSGTALGPFIGGIFASPSDTWPDTIGRIHLLQEYPYLLPCAVSALIAFTTFLAAFAWLKETSPTTVRRLRLQQRRRYLSSSALASTNSCDYGTNSDGNREPAETTPPPLRALLVCPLLMTLLNYAFLCFIDSSNTVLLPLVCSTPIAIGGLGMNPYQIGTMMGSMSFIKAAIYATVRGYFIRKFGAKRCFMVGLTMFFLSFTAYPIVKFLVRSDVEFGMIMGFLVISQLSFKVASSACFGSIRVLVVETCPSRASLGSANGIAQLVSSGVNTLTPMMASSLFSISLERQIAGGNLVFIVILGVILLGIRTSFLLPVKSLQI